MNAAQWLCMRSQTHSEEKAPDAALDAAPGPWCERVIVTACRMRA